MTKNAPLSLSAGENALTLPGVSFTSTGLRWKGEPSERTVTNTGRVLRLMRSVVDWGEADYLPRMVALALGRRPKRNAKYGQTNSDQMELGVITSYAELNGRNPRALHVRDAVGRFFPADDRRPELSFDHHAEAWSAADGDLKKARGWLDAAVEGKFTVSQLRAHIHGKTQTGIAPAHTDATGDAELARLDLAAARLIPQVRSYDQARANAQLHAMASVVALVDALRERASCQASTFGNVGAYTQTQGGGGKESLGRTPSA